MATEKIGKCGLSMDRMFMIGPTLTWIIICVNNLKFKQCILACGADNVCNEVFFNHDPQKGFESVDIISKTSLENNPQNNQNNTTYNVVLQWDSTGYTYTISHGSVVDSTGHTDVLGMSNDLWVGWDGSYNNFQTFPSGNWQGIVPSSPLNRTGGSDMILKPFPVYRAESISMISTLSLPNKGTHTVGGINPTRGRTNLTPFTFQVVYTDGNNNAPQNVKASCYQHNNRDISS